MLRIKFYGVIKYISLFFLQQWFHSYINLFIEPCKRCGLHLHNSIPPTWRDPRSLEPYHFECKP